jgi:hypothetical protein
MKIFSSNVTSVLFYGAETWRTTKAMLLENPKIHQLLPTKNHEHPMVRQSQK